MLQTEGGHVALLGGFGEKPHHNVRKDRRNRGNDFDERPEGVQDAVNPAHYVLGYTKAVDQENFEGLILDNPDLATVMDSVHFNHAGLYQHHGQSLKISNNANFTNCYYFISYADSINISHSSFNNTFVYFNNVTPQQTGVAVIDSNTFNTSTNPYGSDMIDINDFGKFNIYGNTIYEANNNGIGLYYCGHATAGNQNVQNNHITYCDGYGINAYNSTALIKNNQIQHNDRGLNLLDCSSVRILGNPNAIHSYETQGIDCNTNYEIYTNDESFPSIQNNMIYDNNRHDRISNLL